MGSIITLTSHGNFKKTHGFLKAIKNFQVYSILDSYGQKGVDLLKDNTPVRTGATAAAWSYEKVVSEESITLSWKNSSLANDGKTPIVILIIKGHGTRNGGYVAPNDFVTPNMEKLFQEAVEAVWKVVTSL